MRRKRGVKGGIETPIHTMIFLGNKLYELKIRDNVGHINPDFSPIYYPQIASFLNYKTSYEVSSLQLMQEVLKITIILWKIRVDGKLYVIKDGKFQNQNCHKVNANILAKLVSLWYIHFSLNHRSSRSYQFV